MAYVIASAGCVLTIALLDFLWLSRTVEPLYRGAHGAIMAERPNMIAAAFFYLLYVPGILIFAVRPALAASDWRVAALQGALFGLFCFATYDLTNLATLKAWTLRVSLIDIIWGMCLTGAAATAGAMAAMTFAPR